LDAHVISVIRTGLVNFGRWMHPFVILEEVHSVGEVWAEVRLHRWVERVRQSCCVQSVHHVQYRTVGYTVQFILSPCTLLLLLLLLSQASERALGAPTQYIDGDEDKSTTVTANNLTL